MKNNADTNITLTSDSIRIMTSPSDFAKKYLFYVKETGYIDGESFSCGGHENLESYLLMYVCDGEGVLEYEHNKYLLTDDNIFLINCRKPYKFYTPDEKIVRVLYVYFDGIQAEGYYSLISKNISPVFVIENKKTLRSPFWQIVSLNQKNLKYAELLTSLNIDRLLTDICMLCTNDYILEAEYPDCVNYTFDYIAKNYNKKITLDILSEVLFVNKYYLSREFKRCTGTTIYEHLTTIRINKAKTYLRYSNKSIEEISEKTGFYNATHFIRAFRNSEQVTPLSYRKQWTL